MPYVKVERISPELYCIHSTTTWNGNIVAHALEGNIVVTAQEMLTIMNWCQLNLIEIEKEARKMNRRAEKRNRKRGQA